MLPDGVGGNLTWRTAEMEQALAEVSRLVEARDWNAAKQVALRLKYLEGIRQAATERMDDHARDAVE